MPVPIELYFLNIGVLVLEISNGFIYNLLTMAKLLITSNELYSSLDNPFVFQMDQLSSLLANRRIPGEHPGRRIEAIKDEDSEDREEPSIEEVRI